MIEIEYEPVATSSDGTFNLEDTTLDGGDHLMVVQATNEDGEVSAYSDETVYSQDYAKFVIQKSTLTAIADSVRAKTGKPDLIPTLNLASEIDSIMDLDDFMAKLQTGVTVYKNGNYIPPSGYYGYTSFSVEVPVPQAEEKSVTPAKSEQIVEPSSSEYLLSKVTVAPIPDDYMTRSEFVDTLTELRVYKNGYYVGDKKNPGFDRVTVEIPNEPITVTPSFDEQVIDPPNEGYFSQVTVKAVTTGSLPEMEWTLRDTLDFTMIPSTMYGAKHYIYFDLPDTGSNQTYIGLIINDGELKAIPTNNIGTPITLYDSTGWADPKYKNLHCDKAVVSTVLYNFITDNYIYLISFIVNNITMRAEYGMTWDEWIKSPYNTGDFVASGNNVSVSGAPTNHKLYDEHGVDVLLTEEIISGGKYSF